MSLPQAWTGTWLPLTLTTLLLLLGLCENDIVAALAIGAANPIRPAVVTARARAWRFLSITFPSPFFIYRRTLIGLPPDGHRRLIHTFVPDPNITRVRHDLATQTKQS